MKTTKTIMDLCSAGKAEEYRAYREELREAVSLLEATYTETRDETPTDTVKKYMALAGSELAQIAVATLVNRHAWDGRISRRSAEWAAGIAGSWDEDAACRMGIYTNKIHLAHLDQIAQAMRKVVIA